MTRDASCSFGGFQILGLLTVALITGLTAVGAQAQGETEPAWETLDQRPGQGQRCLVCGVPIKDEDAIEIRYKGRVFFVSEAMLQDFAADPDTYFAQLQARSALFDESSMAGRQMSSGWLLFGAYMVLGLVCGALCGYLAIGRGHPPLLWFFAGLVGNLAALLVLLLTPRKALVDLGSGLPIGLVKVPTTRAPVACPNCGSPNHPAAALCSGCGSPLVATVESETARA